MGGDVRTTRANKQRADTRIRHHGTHPLDCSSSWMSSTGVVATALAGIIGFVKVDAKKEEAVLPSLSIASRNKSRKKHGLARRDRSISLST